MKRIVKNIGSRLQIFWEVASLVSIRILLIYYISIDIPKNWHCKISKSTYVLRKYDIIGKYYYVIKFS